ncbi:signal peptidase II [Pantoea sp. Aalb]|uniref:signal peptidase II n=1 Tax=Pantoea sp. Aalb TaxID=2576762 RepID=UPI001322C5EF|nr:signal peptidase II [Pantoea sp. Aalb]MXP67161.1 lipoprotein signal peptidase [Pantoea sp. Aalb]
MIMKNVFSTGLRWLWLTLIVIIIDFTSKQWIINNTILHKSQSLIPFLNLFYTKNYGAAFSFLAYQNGWQRWLFAGIAVIIVTILFIKMYYTPVNNTLINIAYALLCGGALGNLFDRVYHGYVIDFIDFYISIYWHFATFNIADFSICLGGVLIILQNFLITKKEKNK